MQLKKTGLPWRRWGKSTAWPKAALARKGFPNAHRSTPQISTFTVEGMSWGSQPSAKVSSSETKELHLSLKEKKGLCVQLEGRERNMKKECSWGQALLVRY